MAVLAIHEVCRRIPNPTDIPYPVHGVIFILLAVVLKLSCHFFVSLFLDLS